MSEYFTKQDIAYLAGKVLDNINLRGEPPREKARIVANQVKELMVELDKIKT